VPGGWQISTVRQLFFDEIQCGLGRTGTSFAFQSFGRDSGYYCDCKPIAAGLPLGAFLARKNSLRRSRRDSICTTFGGGPLCLPVALEFLAIIEERKAAGEREQGGAYLQQELKGLVESGRRARSTRKEDSSREFNSTCPRGR